MDLAIQYRLFVSRLQDFADGKIELKILQGVFTPRNSFFPKIFASCKIKTGSDGRYIFNCTAVSASKPFDTEMFRLRGSIQVGAFLSDDEFYEFEGLDELGYMWKIKRIHLPIFYNTQATFLSDFSRGSSDLHCQLKIPSSGADNIILIELRADENYKYLSHPNTELSLKFSDGDVTVLTVSARNGWYQMQLKSSASLRLGLEWKIVEAVEVTCDFTLRVSQVFRICGDLLECQLYSTKASASTNRPAIFPIADNAEFRPELEDFLVRYIEMSYANSGDYDRLHPCSYYLRMLRSESQYSFDVDVMVASIVCEGLLHMVDKNIQIDNEFLKAINIVENEINKLNLDQRHSSRLLGKISGLKTVSPKDKFKLLIKEALVREEDVDAWMNLRDKYAHIKSKSFVNENNIKERYYELMKLKNLALSMVMHITQYRGHFLNYAIHGHPITKYPYESEILR